MISLIDKVEFINTPDETKALLLEASLIKEIKPKFNILLKDDKTYPNIEFRLGHKWPQIKNIEEKKIKVINILGHLPQLITLMLH